MWLDRGLAFFPVPGGHRALGWLHLLRAHVLRQLGDIESSTSSAAAAQEVFTKLGERHGLIAAQRICKEGLPSLPAQPQAMGGPGHRRTRRGDRTGT
jgi:hypothetical protein